MKKIKKPSAQEFSKEYELTTGTNAEKVFKLAGKYGREIRTIYRWIRNIKNGDIIIDEHAKKNWNDWVGDYSDPEDQLPDYNQYFTLENDSLIVCLADTHFGNKSLKLALSKLDADMQEIMKHDDVYVIFVGDLIDYGPAHPRGLQHDQQLSYTNQLSMANSFINEFGEKIIALASGCHSHFTYNVTGDFPERTMAENTFGGLFMGDGGVLHLTAGTQLYKIFMSHKARGGSKKSPALSLLNYNMEVLDFDVGVTAQKHTPNISSRLIRGKEIHMINCGSNKGLDTYARKIGFAPAPIRTPCFYINSKERKIVSFLDFKTGIDYLESLKCSMKSH